MKTASILAAVLLAGTASAAPRHHHRKEVAQSEEPDAEPSDGPEAQAMLPIKLDDLIEVAVRLAPDLARAKVDRSIAKDAAEGARRDQALGARCPGHSVQLRACIARYRTN